MNTYLENVTAKKLSIAFPITKIQYGINFDLYCKQMLLSPLGTLFKKIFEQAYAIINQQQQNEAELWSLRHLFERLQRIQLMFARLQQEEELYLKNNKDYDTLLRKDQTHKKILEMIAQRLREYREQFEKITAHLAITKKNIDSCLKKIRELNLQISSKSNAIVGDCFEIQKAISDISKNSDNFIHFECYLKKQLANSGLLSKEIRLANLRQFKAQIYQAPDRYLGWLAEQSPTAEVDSRIQADRESLMASYQGLIADINYDPDNKVWTQELNQTFSEMIKCIDIIVAKRKRIINLIKEVQIDRISLEEKQAEFKQQMKLAKKSIDEIAALKKLIPQYIRLNDGFFNPDQLDSFEVKRQFKQKHDNFNIDNSDNDLTIQNQSLLVSENTSITVDIIGANVVQSNVKLESNLESKLDDEPQGYFNQDQEWFFAKPLFKY